MAGTHKTGRGMGQLPLAAGKQNELLDIPRVPLDYNFGNATLDRATKAHSAFNKILTARHAVPRIKAIVRSRPINIREKVKSALDFIALRYAPRAAHRANISITRKRVPLASRYSAVNRK